MNKTRFLNSTNLPSACSKGMTWAVWDRFPNFAVSDCGDVVRLSDEKRIRGSVNSDGYLSYSLTSEDRTRKHIAAHQLVAMCFISIPDPEGKQVAHRNGSRLMNHFANLRWSTVLENHEDRRVHGTGPSGEKNPNAKLTEADVLTIRKMHAAIKMRDLDMKMKDLAAMFGIHPATLSNIARRKIWPLVA